MFTLRPYQEAALEALRDKIRNGIRKLVLIAPTGSGKTVVAAAMIRAAADKGSRVVFIAHRRELIDQAVNKLILYGVESGVVMASDSRQDSSLPVQVCSIQTLIKRMDRLPPADLVIYDEAHHSLSESSRKVMSAYSKSVAIGLTATPWRTDKMGLADVYHGHVVAATPAELIASGALVGYDAFAYDAPDLHEVRVTAGEFNQKDLGIACNTKILVGSVVREYINHAKKRPAILFPVDINHSLALVEELNVAGVRAVHIDHSTKKPERQKALEDFSNGLIDVLSSVGVLTEGFDAPIAEVCIVARPTKSLTLHLQMIGRVLRPCPESGKSRALIHDHAGNMLRHGMPDEERDYSLNATPQRVRAMRTCPYCFHVFTALRNGKCPNCGETLAEEEEEPIDKKRTGKRLVEGTRISKEEIIAIRERRKSTGLTRDLSDLQIAKVAAATKAEKIAEYLRLSQVAAVKGFKKGFISHQFRELFGHWPKFSDGDLFGATAASRPFLPLPKRENA